jgi:LCP family protein required for cell wall assembly
VLSSVVGLSISATWTLWLGLGLFAVFVVVAVLPALVLRNRPHRTWFQRTILSFNIWLIVAALLVVRGLTWIDDEVQEVPRHQFGEGVLAEVDRPTEARNFLLVGIDDTAGFYEGSQSGGSFRSDTIMVLQVDPETDEAHLISFPRDLYVPISGVGHSDRINTALQVGGPEALIATLDENFGIPIHHYVQVNFLGFQELVGIIGGVPMYFEHPTRDRTMGFRVDVPPGGGCVTLGPSEALDFVRSRREYAELIDGNWQVDPTADLGRIRRQQLFMRLALGRALDQGLRDPRVMQELLDVGQEHVVVDESLAIGDLVDLGSRLREFQSGDLTTHNLPVRIGNVGAASVVFLEEEDARDDLQWFQQEAPDGHARSHRPQVTIPPATAPPTTDDGIGMVPEQPEDVDCSS